MKKIINAIRDFLYILTDYGLIITVAVIMIAVLGWRFNILFNRDIEKETLAVVPNDIQVEVPVTNDQTNNDKDEEIPNKEEDEEEPTEPNNPTPTESDVVATVEIPAGSFPSKIGDILINSNLIVDKNEFLNRSVEMGLDTKLQSGSFEISIGTNLDDIIKIIAKAN
ncbi:hypothetical protein J2Z76_000894 [Sedimentibacter acidaminivorans]|uniref:Endolytic transglycosylase MltG n=1 Tax=Sedimentibacter acidaminivorans TaxID=913099 RepID=A0ABS4GBI7_9FIRM|nr:hypothetical protein [Sedimentibacter acidaminivorans]MBP1925037.1 hypothetical protein [Sedimentibacter acidaminivorans]